MTEADLKPVYFDFLNGDSEGASFQKLTTAMASIFRESIVDGYGGRICPATILFHDNTIRVTVAKPISSEDLQRLNHELAESLPRHSENLIPMENVTTIINDLASEDYKFNPDAEAFRESIVIPLTLKEQTMGLLFLGAFDDKVKLNSEDFLNLFRSDFSQVLKQLWDLNRQGKESFALLFSKIADGVILCNPEKEILFINRAAKQMLDIDAEKPLIGKSLSAMQPDYLTHFLEEALTDDLYEINKVVSLKDEHSKLIGVHTEILRNSKNKKLVWMISLRDVTLNWQNDQMRSALTIASHEIKTPLNSIDSAINLLLDKDLGPLTQQQHQCLNVVKDDINRLRRLVTDILDLSRFDEGVQFLDRRREVSIGLLIKRVMASFQEFADSKNIVLEAKVPKSIPTFRGDRDRIQQVLVNLVENSIKYSLPGGRVEIQAELVGSILKVWVSDTGVGIPSTEFENIFDKFKQLENSPDQHNRGYGLGLSIAKDIVVDTIGGKIWVESEVGTGSTFYFNIPV